MVAVVHPDARVVRNEGDVVGLLSSTFKESIHHGLPVAGDAVAGDHHSVVPMQMHGCGLPLWLSMCMITMSPSRTTNIGTSDRGGH